MGSGVVTVGRRRYASGLYWENSPSGNVAQVAREAAHQPGHTAEFFAVRSASKSGRVPQFALSQSVEGHAAGMPSFAGCLVNQQPGSWVGAFRLREGTAVVIVRDDLLVPDGDQFFLDETEARDRLLQEMALGGLQRVYAPEAWGVPGVDTMPISLLLNDSTDIKLRPVDVPRGTLYAAVGGITLLLIVLGIGWYIQAEAARDEEMRLAQEEAVRRAAKMAQGMLPVSQIEPPHPPPERRWEKLPSPFDVVEGCRVALSEAPVVVAGWQRSGLRCDGRNLVINLTRSGGFTSLPPHAVVNDTGTAATMTFPLSVLKPRGEEALMDQADVVARALAQNWPGGLVFANDDPLPKPPEGYSGPWNPPKPPWGKQAFTFVFPALPWTLPAYFSGVPGVVVESLSLAGGANASWTINGVIYENRR